MLKNYLKIAWRNFKRDKSYSLINTVGLAIALSVFIIIGLFIYDELSYDRYHQGADQIYRVYKAGEGEDVSYKSLATSNLLAPTLKSDISGIKEVARISKRFAGSLVESETQKWYEDGLFLTDPSLFDVFSFSFIRGNPETALNRAFTVVLTESAVRRYFGDANPIGKTVWITSLFGEEEYEVTGVIEDVPKNTHFTFELLTSLETLRTVSPSPKDDFESWFHVGTYTYVKLQEGVFPAEIEAQFPEFLTTHQGERAQNSTMVLQPLLSKDFLKLVVLGFVIAVPVAWYAMNRWLADFAYRIEIGPGIFILAGGAAIVIALATVSWQSIRAALANPVESLKSE